MVFKTSPRLKEDDQAVIKHWLEGTGVKFEYTPSSNTLVFTIPVQGNDMEFDGTNTGGQFIRSLVTIATLASSSKVHPKDLTVTNPKKGTGLYVQACMYRLEDGETFTFTGGMPTIHRLQPLRYGTSCCQISRDLQGGISL